jgi:pimeloyl-ACP methyl ester carboxylesterase
MHLAGIHANYNRLREAVLGGRPFSKPALFLRAENSDYIGEEGAKEIVRLFPQARLQVVRGAGHWLHAEAPVEFTRHVLEFLSEK